MDIRTLENTSLEDIVKCLSISFADYFVPMPDSVDFWRQRFEAARVDLSLSFGVFDQQQLVGFIINAIDMDNKQKTAFNAGTGVLPEYRGNQWVDKIYEAAIPKLKQAGVEKCKLEVIDKNDRAVRVYERIGFSIIRRVKCYKGDLPELEQTELTLEQFDKEQLADFEPPPSPYTWDNTLQTLLNTGDKYQCYQVRAGERDIGYFVINPKIGYLAQLEAYHKEWPQLFAGVRQVSPAIRINNIDTTRHELIDFLNQLKIENGIDQFEMEMPI